MGGAVGLLPPRAQGDELLSSEGRQASRQLERRQCGRRQHGRRPPALQCTAAVSARTATADNYDELIRRLHVLSSKCKQVERQMLKTNAVDHAQ